MDVKLIARAAGALLACSTAHSASASDIVIENATIIDGAGSPPHAGRHILIKDDRIVFVEDEPVKAAPGAIRIDATGKFLIPGLIDTHVHLRGAADSAASPPRRQNRREAEQALASYLYAGVTTIYDAGNDPDFIFELRADEQSGRILSPRIFATGGIVTYPGSHGSSPYATHVESWPAAAPGVEAHAARKPDMVKFTLEERGWGARPLIPMLPVDLLQRLVEFFNDRGVRTTVHASSELRAREAIFAGVDTLAHPVIQGPVSDNFVRLMAVKKVPMSSTLTIGESYSRLAENPNFLDQPLYQAALSSREIEKLKTETRKEFQERSWTWWMKIMTPIAQENLRKIHEAGGVIALGTDQTIGPAVHREMELLAGAGIAPIDVIKIATHNAARFLGLEDQIGLVAPGMKADLVLLGADPSINIDNAKAIELVIKNGAVIDRRRLPVAGTIEP
ncbi:MAG: amidohydrolase family protein [Parvularculaceae bacterium]|nr:amidohydrolase family protein [Parvularculaceae bacterium]